MEILPSIVREDQAYVSRHKESSFELPQSSQPYSYVMFEGLLFGPHDSEGRHPPDYYTWSW